MKYGPWQGRARRLLEDQKELIKSNSLQLGISLQFVLEELEPLYREKAEEAEWRLDEWGPTTKSEFLVKVRNLGLDVDPMVAWEKMLVCSPAQDPNFHTLAGLLAYGPHALGKGQICPRDGREDCSIVDALFRHDKSAKANWFLSWVWGYSLSTMVKALEEWWRRFEDKTGWSVHDSYLFWCVFVNNQFRILQDGEIEESPRDLFDSLGRQLKGIGRMIMCLDKLHNSGYTCRIWCLLEVYIAIQHDIKIALAIPPDALDIDDICGRVDSLQEIFDFCRVDSANAIASVQEDAVTIKRRILDDDGGFHHLDTTVEEFLVRGSSTAEVSQQGL